MELCFYFQVHQPVRLKQYSLFQRPDSLIERYFDQGLNEQIMHKVAQKCYLPTNNLLLELLAAYPEFKVSFSLTGVFMEQAQQYSPAVLDSFRELGKTGRVDFLSETYYHSLAALFPETNEFLEQIALHKKEIARFAPEPKVFRNTEAMFSNEIARLVESQGYDGILTEGWDPVLTWRSPNYLYRVRGCQRIKALLRNYKLSDDVGYRFSARWWPEYPLTADKYVHWLAASPGDCINIFMDYETFGEHQWSDTGIFEFLRHLPEQVGRHRHLHFTTPDALVKARETVGEIDVPYVISWADMERDTSAWLGNEMQRECFQILQELEKPVKESKNAEWLHVWRLLQNSDHLYYLSTKSLSDQDVHNYFSPYEGPFDAYINFRNILQDFREEVKGAEKAES